MCVIPARAVIFAERERCRVREKAAFRALRVRAYQFTERYQLLKSHQELDFLVFLRFFHKIQVSYACYFYIDFVFFFVN